MQHRPFYFMVAFWGQKYRDWFYTLCVPSLLAPNNIPVLKDRQGSKIVIATTVDDWNALQERPLVKQLANYVDLFPIFIGEPAPGASLQLHAARGHRLACRKAYEDQAFAGWLTPDLIISNGMIQKAVDLIDRGKKLVLCPALRFEMERPIEELSAKGYLQANKPINVSAECLSTIAVSALHPELLRYEFGSNDFDDYPIWTFWRVPERNGLILYTVSWSILFGDFAAIPNYRDECFDYSTNDGYFSDLNFGHLRNTDHVAYLDDSYDGVFLSLTPKNEFVFKSAAARKDNKWYGWLGLGDIKRYADIYRFHRCSDIDQLRRSFHNVPIIIHGDPIDARYQQWIADTQRRMRLATQTPPDRWVLYSVVKALSGMRGVSRLCWTKLPYYWGMLMWYPKVAHVILHDLITGKKTVRYIARRFLEEIGIIRAGQTRR